jgi:hypothetical protein
MKTGGLVTGVVVAVMVVDMRNMMALIVKIRPPGGRLGKAPSTSE